MNNFIYTIMVNMVTNTCKSLAPLDFHQGDSRLSTLMFHLNNSKQNYPDSKRRNPQNHESRAAMPILSCERKV